MFQLVLIYDKAAKYFSSQSSIINNLAKIKEIWGIDFEIIESSALDELTTQKVKSDIRSILPQVRGKIVSSKSHILPFSGKKNLNLKNTQILIFYRNKIPINVFPHLLGLTYYSIKDFVDIIQKYGPEDYVYIKGLLEDPLQKILSEFPSILEEGMNFVDINVELENGEIDLLVKDRVGKYAIIELETFARDISVTQVCRLGADFSEKNSYQTEVRKIIVCLDFAKNVLKACEGAGVELYKVKLEREC